MRKAGVYHLWTIALVDEIGDVVEGALSPLYRLYEHRHRYERIVSLDDYVHRRILNELIGIIGGRNSSKDDERIRMDSLHPLRNFDGAMAVGHPVQIDSKDRRVQSSQQAIHVEVWMHQHERGQVDNLSLQAVFAQTLLDGEKAKRIHLVDGGDVDAIRVA